MSDAHAGVRALAGLTADLVSEHDRAGVLARLVDDCAAVVPAEAVALLVVDEDAELTLLTASSHRAQELEMLQAQRGDGPCVEAIRSTTVVSDAGVTRLAARWGEVGSAISAAGFGAVDAFPMRWRDRSLGGLNVFREREDPLDEDTVALCQAFADVASLLLVQASDIPGDQVTAKVHEAVMARAQVEQAKGVLAYRENLTMEEAYEHLRRLAESNGDSLTATALRVVRDQYV